MKHAVLLTALLALGCDSSETPPGLLDKIVPVNTAKTTSGDFPVNRVYPAIASPVIQITSRFTANEAPMEAGSA